MGRVACIAGSGTERGRAIAARLTDEGWKVVQLDGPDGQDARAASPALGIDLGAAADIATIAARLGVDYDEVGAYIHCACAPPAGVATEPSVALALQAWDAALAIHLEAPLLISQLLVRPMLAKGWGRVLFVGEHADNIPHGAQETAFACSMSGLIGLARSIASETGPHGVTANVILPGPLQPEPDPFGLGPRCTYETDGFAATVAFLLSDGARLVNGATIHANGGQAMR